MEEKNSIKVSLGTVICLFIIFILIIAMGGMWYYFTQIKPTESESVNKAQAIDNRPAIDNTNNIDNEKYELSYGTYNIDTDTIKSNNIDAESVDITFKEDDTFVIYMGWGQSLLGEYEVNSSKIKCNVKYFSYESSPIQPINAEIEFKIENKSTIEVTKASSTYIIRTVDMVNNTLEDETKEMSLLPIEKGVTFIRAKENTVSNDRTEEKQSIKIDDSRELVYDANYSYKNFSDESYSNQNLNQPISFKDISLPYININSEDASNANKEIKDLFEELAEFFEEEYRSTKTWYKIASYKTFTKGNVLSILITVESGGTDVEVYKYYTYNFNLDTLKLYSYEEIYKLAGFSSNNIDDKVEESIKKSEMITKLKEEFDLTTYIEESIKNYTNSVENKSIKYFIDGNNELNIIVKIELPVGRQEFDTIIKVK